MGRPFLEQTLQRGLHVIGLCSWMDCSCASCAQRHYSPAVASCFRPAMTGGPAYRRATDRAGRSTSPLAWLPRTLSREKRSFVASD